MTENKLALHGGSRAVPQDLFQPWPEIRPEDREAVLRVLDRGILWGGHSPEVRALEQEWAAWVGDLGYCLATNSGTAALHMAVAAVGVGPGDEVITTPFSWTSTATCILHHNAIPVFADIDPATFTIDPARIEAKITPHTKAIIPVHLYGLAADMDAILDIARRHDLAVIEDCCQAHGAEYRGRRVGTLGDIAAFSVNGSKHLSAGEGGLLVTNSEHLWQEAARVQQFGERRIQDGPRMYDAYGMGWMYRMPEMTAAFARSQLERLDEIIARTRENAHRLAAGLGQIGGLILPYEPEECKHVYFRYSVRLNLEELGIGTPVDEYVPKVLEALAAEGVVLSRAEFVIPGMTLFQQREGYGRGCPWTCHHYGTDTAYDPSDYPNAMDAKTRFLAPVGLTPPNGAELMDCYVEAFRKVVDNIGAVLAD